MSYVTVTMMGNALVLPPVDHRIGMTEQRIAAIADWQPPGSKWCWATCAAMSLRASGALVDQAAIVRAVTRVGSSTCTPNWPARLTDVKNELNGKHASHFSLYATETDVSLPNLEMKFRHQRPVIIHLSQGAAIGHAVLAVALLRLGKDWFIRYIDPDPRQYQHQTVLCERDYAHRAKIACFIAAIRVP